MTEPRYPLLGLNRHRMEIDGEGVTTLVAGAGCPLSCAYCINKSILRQAPNYVTPRELYEKVRVDDLYFRATGGGLCFGGGEALLHLDFYGALRPLCPDWRFTAESCLNLPSALVARAVGIFDAFIVDVKTLDQELALHGPGDGAAAGESDASGPASPAGAHPGPGSADSRLQRRFGSGQDRGRAAGSGLSRH